MILGLLRGRSLCSIAAACVVAMLAGCASFDDTLPPRISLADIELAEPGLLRQDFVVDLRIANPNNIDIPVEGLTIQLEIDDQPFAEGMSNECFTLPRLSEVSLPVKASTDTLSLMRQIMSLGRSERITYRISGVAYVSGFVGARRVPYERKGSLSLLPPAPPDGDAPDSGLRWLAPS